MKSLVFATNNPNKIAEVSGMLEGKFEIKSLEEIGCNVELPETQDFLEGNAAQKSGYILEHFKSDCFADDTGLEIEALDGKPGVYSARFAGPQRDSDDNMDLVLKELEGKTNRNAQFRTVVSLEFEGERHLFEGICEGTIRREKVGAKGFGYDPIFQPNGYDKTFAELSSDEKNKISHRGNAIRKLIQFLTESAENDQSFL